MSRIGLNCTLLTPNPTETILDFILYTSYQLFLLPLILYSVESLSFFLMLLLTIYSITCSLLFHVNRHDVWLVSHQLLVCLGLVGIQICCSQNIFSGVYHLDLGANLVLLLLSQIASHTVLLRSLTALWGTANILPANHLTATPVAMIQTAYWSSKWATEWGRQIT